MFVIGLVVPLHPKKGWYMRHTLCAGIFVLLCHSATVLAGPLDSDIPPAFQSAPNHRTQPSLASRVWKADATKSLLAGIALTRIAAHFDGSAQYEARTSMWAETDAIDAGDSYGNGAYLAALTAVTWGYGSLTGNGEIRQTGTSMMKGLLLDVVAVTALKSAVGRTRPDGSDARSFPSGHTSGAFTISTILSRRHGWKVGIPAYGLATFTAIARMEDNRHYFSDVVAGAAIGIAVGQLVTPKAREEGRGVQVIAGPSKVGLRLKF